nr:centromere protein H isoform X1 [Oryctolagus cuniculus]
MESQPEKRAAAEPADSGGEGGAGGLPQVAGGRSEDRVTLLLRLRAQIKQQLVEYKSMVDANEEKTPEQIMQENQIEDKIEELENEIEEVKIAYEMKSIALNRIQRSTALQNNLEKIDAKNSEFMDNMKQILKLNKLIIRSQKESRSLERKRLEIRKKRLDLKKASESKLLEIQTEKNKQKEDLDSMENSDKIKTIRQNLQMEINVTTVIQHVFQPLPDLSQPCYLLLGPSDGRKSSILSQSGSQPTTSVPEVQEVQRDDDPSSEPPLLTWSNEALCAATGRCLKPLSPGWGAEHIPVVAFG